MAATPKIRVGDRYLAEVEVVRVSDDAQWITLRFPAYGVPITLFRTAFDRDDILKAPKP